ncbi:hypothetical protein HY837_07085, partial [archaeon]|nr:hypothetical protein [archaeon]
MVCDDPDGGWSPNNNAEVSMWDRIICTEKCEVINGQDYVFECFCGNKQAKGGGQGSGNELCSYGCSNGACLAAPTTPAPQSTPKTEVDYIVDDKGPASDVVLASNLANQFSNYSSQSLLNSQVTRKDLDDKLGVFIYYGAAVIMLGQNAPAKLAVLAGNIQIYLRTQHNIYSSIKLNTEMPDDKFAKYFVKTFKELYKGDKKDTAFGDLEVTDIYGPPNQGNYYSSFTLNGVKFNNVSFNSQAHPQLGQIFVTDMYKGNKGTAIDVLLVPPSKDIYSAGGQQKGSVLGPWNKRFEITDLTQNDATYMIEKEIIHAKLLGQATTVHGITAVPTKIYNYNNVQYLNTLLAKDT